VLWNLRIEILGAIVLPGLPGLAIILLLQWQKHLNSRLLATREKKRAGDRRSLGAVAAAWVSGWCAASRSLDSSGVSERKHRAPILDRNEHSREIFRGSNPAKESI